MIWLEWNFDEAFEALAEDLTVLLEEEPDA